jgi:hypothetical protein
LGVILGAIFDKKSIFFGIIFTSFFGRHFERILVDFGAHFGAIFYKKSIFFGIIFTSFFGRHFERILVDFGAHFHDFWAPKSTLNPKGRKYEKPMFYLRKTYVFEGPGLSFLVENQ